MIGWQRSKCAIWCALDSTLRGHCDGSWTVVRKIVGLYLSCPYQKLHSFSFGGAEVSPIARARCVRRRKKTAERHVPVEGIRRVAACSGGNAFVTMMQSANLRISTTRPIAGG